MRLIVALAILVASQARAEVSAVTPDYTLTPGATDSNVTQENIHITICQHGYTAKVRNVSESVKNQVYKEYGITSHAPGEYEIDHLISLELGGSNDITNLWPQSYVKTPGAHQKDVVENGLHRAVCCETMKLLDAQDAIAHNWLEYYDKIKAGTWHACPTKTPKKKSHGDPAEEGER